MSRPSTRSSVATVNAVHKLVVKTLAPQGGAQNRRGRQRGAPRGFWKLYDRSRLDGERINHKRLHRVYCAMKLNLPRRTKRRLPQRRRQPLAAPDRLNDIWALDFMADALYGGRPFRTLNVIDEGNRQVLGIEVATSIPSLTGGRGLC